MVELEKLTKAELVELVNQLSKSKERYPALTAENRKPMRENIVKPNKPLNKMIPIEKTQYHIATYIAEYKKHKEAGNAEMMTEYERLTKRDYGVFLKQFEALKHEDSEIAKPFQAQYDSIYKIVYPGKKAKAVEKTVMDSLE